MVLQRFRRGAISEAAMDVELAAAGRERAMVDQQIESARRAQFAAGRTVQRVAALETLVRALRQRLDSAAPSERQRVVQALVRSRGATLSPSTIVLDVRICPAGSASTSYDDVTNMSFRLVA